MQAFETGRPIFVQAEFLVKGDRELAARGTLNYRWVDFNRLGLHPL
ncbi:MAG: hypothetical protein FLDDKLPJ_01324 [Phycisphaerae bacterium]|nr:hypothetical protein [Phycisphaerae bacterium]